MCLNSPLAVKYRMGYGNNCTTDFKLFSFCGFYLYYLWKKENYMNKFPKVYAKFLVVIQYK